MISVAPTMSAAYRYANLCAHRTPLFFFKQKTAYEIMAPNVETSTEARIRKRPSVAVIRSLFALQPVGALHQLFELLFVDRVPRLRRAILVAVRHHQAIALEVAALDHRPLDDDADVLAEHLRRHAVRLDVDGLGAVVDVELDAGDPGVVLDRAARDHAAEADGRAVGLVAVGDEVGRRPVVDEVLVDAAPGDDDEGRAGDEEGGKHEEAGAPLHLRSGGFQAHGGHCSQRSSAARVRAS